MGDYQFNCLETLRNRKALLYGLTLKNRNIDPISFQAIQKVVALTLQGKQLEALKLACSSLMTERFCIMRSDEFFEMKSNIQKYLGISKKGF